MDQLRSPKKFQHSTPNKDTHSKSPSNDFRNTMHNPFTYRNLFPNRPPPQRVQQLPPPQHVPQFMPRPPTQNQPSSLPQYVSPNPVQQNFMPSARRNLQPQRMPNRPYPTPNNIGKRFQNNPSHPMSGVSTIKANLNSHLETREDTFPEDAFPEETEQSFSSEYDNYPYPYVSYESMEEFPTETEYENQDFREARPFDWKT